MAAMTVVASPAPERTLGRGTTVALIVASVVALVFLVIAATVATASVCRTGRAVDIRASLTIVVRGSERRIQTLPSFALSVLVSYFTPTGTVRARWK